MRVRYLLFAIVVLVILGLAVNKYSEVKCAESGGHFVGGYFGSSRVCVDDEGREVW